jgi:hypothetical protein
MSTVEHANASGIAAFCPFIDLYSFDKGAMQT